MNDNVNFSTKLFCCFVAATTPLLITITNLVILVIITYIRAYINHSHKKRKDSLETRAEPAVFSLQLEFRKFLEASLREPA